MGTSVALHLAKLCDPLNEPVVLLEQSSLGAGSSGRSGAIVRQYYADREVATMARDSLRVWSTFLQATGYRVGFVRSGVLSIAGPRTSEMAARLTRNVEMLRGLGINIEMVEGDELRSLVPGLVVADDTLGAYEPEAGFVHPLRALHAFATLARFHGATTKQNTPVRRILVEGGRVRGVETADGVLETERVVLAAGPWTRRIASELGIELPLEIVRPQQHFVGLPGAAPGAPAALAEDISDIANPLDDTAIRAGVDAEAAPTTAHPVLLDFEHRFYARCDPEEQRARLGEVDEENMQPVADPDALEEAVDGDFVRWARSAAAQRYPAYAEVEDRGSQAAMYTMTPDFQGLIGPLQGIEGLTVVSGFSGHGFKLAPSVGEGVARMVRGEVPGTFDPSFFDPERFRVAGRAAPSGGAFGGAGGRHNEF